MCRLDILVTTRFHAYVLSSSAHVPTIAVSSDTRLQAVFEGEPLSRYCLKLFHSEANEPMVCDMGAWLYERYLDIRQDHGQVKNEFKQRAALYQKRAGANKALLRSWLGDNGYPVSTRKSSASPQATA